MPKKEETDFTNLDPKSVRFSPVSTYGKRYILGFTIGAFTGAAGSVVPVLTSVYKARSWSPASGPMGWREVMRAAGCFGGFFATFQLSTQLLDDLRGKHDLYNSAFSLVASFAVWNQLEVFKRHRACGLLVAGYDMYHDWQMESKKTETSTRRKSW